MKIQHWNKGLGETPPQMGELATDCEGVAPASKCELARFANHHTNQNALGEWSEPAHILTGNLTISVACEMVIPVKDA